MAGLNALPRPEQFTEAQHRLDEARRRLVQDMADDAAWADYLAALDEWQRVNTSGIHSRSRGYIWSD